MNKPGKGPLGNNNLGPWDPYMNKHGKGPLGNATHFKHLSQVVLKKIFQPRTPWRMAILDPGTFI